MLSLSVEMRIVQTPLALIVPLFWAVCIDQVTLLCNVTVSQPWPTPHLLLPSNSSADIYCRATSNDSLSWAVNLAADAKDLQLRTEIERDNRILRTYGVFELDHVIETPGMPPILRLRINNTAVNNGTQVVCTDNGQSIILSIYDPVPLNIEIVDIDKDGINISWSEEPMFTASHEVGHAYAYLLTITNRSSHEAVPLNESHYYFRAPSNASPCEVYNFSVTSTATPVGATYTGDGCGASSPVLSRMLPSPPDITTLEPSLSITLRYESDPTDKFVLTVHFKPADFCESYPVTTYMLLVEGTTASITESATSTNSFAISVNNLPSNEMYTFHLIASNDVGNAMTNKTTIYTTDVQMVTVLPTEGGLNTVMVQCYFVNGSTAEGCMVVLVGEFGNITVNLTRDNSCSTVNTSHPLSSYTGVFGYDIESDGSTGTLAVPGEISDTHNNKTCDVLVDESPSNLAVIVPSVVGGIALVLLLLVIIVFFLLAYKRSRKKVGIDHRSSVTSTPEAVAITNDKELDQAMPVYAQPQNVKQDENMRTAGDGADHSNHYNSTTHTQESPDKADDVNKCAAMYAELKDDTEHFYFTLESSRPPQGVKAPPPADDILSDEDAPPLPPPYNTDQESQAPLPDEDAPPLPPPFIPDQESQPPPLPPVCQYIGCLTSRDSEAVINGIDT